MLTDSFLDKRAGLLPVGIICEVLGKTCIPLAGKRILSLRESQVHPDHMDAMMMELELCIGLIFKPLRHHIKTIINEDPPVLMSVWKPTLDVLQEIMGENAHDEIGQSINELTFEHLRNVITVLISYRVLIAGDEASLDEISRQTWNAISNMDYCKKYVVEWKLSAASPPADSNTPDIGVV
jgi:hypothetical protein